MKRGMLSSHNAALSRILQDIKPSKDEIDIISRTAKNLVLWCGEEIKKYKITADVFLGGSIAKGTLLKTNKYDIDIFVRFSFKNYSEKDKNLSDILEKILKNVFLRFKNQNNGNSQFQFVRVHGSRDYFQIKGYSKQLKRELLFEFVPVLSISRPVEAINVTDLSFFHVNHVKKQIKKKPRIANNILVAKSFCYAYNCYGAESHIRGFSGYALELLVIHYGSFLKLAKAAASWEASIKNRKKIIIDSARHYKKAGDILLELNEAKLVSPIIVIDPTYKVRNAAASVSADTLNRFAKACKKFMNNPSPKFFEIKDIDISKLKGIAKKRKAKLAIIGAETSKTKEDIAAAKLSKFFNFFIHLAVKNSFKVLLKEARFEKQKALLFLIYREPQGKVLVRGPPINLDEHISKFRKKYKKIFFKGNRTYSYSSRGIRDMRGLIGYLKRKHNIRDMGITGLSSS